MSGKSLSGKTLSGKSLSGKTISRKTWIVGALVAVVVLLVGLVGLSLYYENLPEHLSQHETLVLGQSQWVPGSTAAMRVVVRDSRDASPLPNAKVAVRMRPAGGGRAKPLFKGTTDAQGNMDVSFAVPEDADPSQTLIVETQSELGSDRLEHAVTLAREYRVLLTTDKPLYQPGQVIHIRALALSDFDLRPAVGQALQVAVADGKGNTVFRKTLTTSDFGVASVDFSLASEVNSGAYKITASLGDTESEKTVTVEHYVLPKFDVTLRTDRTFYRPGERVEGTLTARYFFGKDVTGGSVVLEGYTYDVARVVAVTLEGTTDGSGVFEFSFELPDYVAGSELDGGLARFYLEARVTDQAEHTEVGRLSLPVAQQALVLDAVLESGRPHPGVENILYVMASYPDGAPAEADLTIMAQEAGEALEARTGPYGLAEVRFIPSGNSVLLSVAARDATGATASQNFNFEGPGSEETVLLRPDAPIYRVGDTMRLTLLTTAQRGTVYVDIVREGQTVSTRAVEVTEGRAEVAVDLTPDLYGTLELHAYKILRSGSVTRDTRLVVVDEADDLQVTLTPGKDVYRPGDDAVLDVQVRGADGAGVPAALGLAVVDASVFALAEQDPGFAKLYFMLEQELLEPKFELHGLSLPEMIGEPVPVDDPVLREAQAGAGKAALASAVAQEAAQGASPFSLSANSHAQAMQRARQKQTAFFAALSKGLYAVFLTIPVAVIALSVAGVWRTERFWRNLGKAFGIGLVLVFSLLGVLWLLDEVLWRVADVVGALVGLALAGMALVSLISLIVAAIKDRDLLLGLALLLLPIFAGVAVALLFALNRSNLVPSDGVLLLAFLTALLLPLAFLLRAARFWSESRQWYAASALLMVILSPVMALLVLFASGGAAMAGGRNDMMVQDMALEAVPRPRAFGMVEDVAVEKEVEVVMDEAAAEGAAPSDDSDAQGAEPPRLRQYFPETMLWLPDAVTDERGDLRLDVPVADSITTWRISALASSQDGRLGSATGGLRVFQDFFIDLDLPLALTVGDEVAVPVGVFNYLPEAQRVRLELQSEPWFELLGEPVQEIEIAGNDITVVYFRIKALAFGRQPFQVTAYGSQMSDAIRKEVRVYPDGKELSFTASDRLDTTDPVLETVRFPAETVPGTQKLLVKIYPGIASQVVEGLDALLRMPFGCFEQTSSTTYPNVLVLDYLKSTDQASPEVQMQAEQYINLGYQRLTTFEVDSEPGGFSLFGNPPADPMLTAYGLQEFGDMRRVYDVDPALIDRIAQWLFSRQRGDGAWAGVEGFHETNLTSQTGPIPVTAFIVWGLADAGYADDARTDRAVGFLRESASQATTAYDLALMANALVAYDRAREGEVTAATEAVLDRLAGMATREDDLVYWEAGRPTYMGGQGVTGDLETTASAALALLRAGRHPDLANAALLFLVRNKDSFGTWQTTSATVMALKALLASVQGGAEDMDATVTVTLNGGQAKTVEVTPETFDVVHLLTFDDVPLDADAQVEIRAEGKGSLMYQVTGRYYLPWGDLARYPELAGAGEDLVTIDVSYDRTELAVDDTVGVDVVVTLNRPDATAESAIVDLGLPPGFGVEREDLERLVARFQDVPPDYAGAKVERFELTGRQIIIYVTDLTGEHPLAFDYRLRAQFPLRAQTPASSAYDYYNPGVAGEAAPTVLTVVD